MLMLLCQSPIVMLLYLPQGLISVVIHFYCIIKGSPTSMWAGASVICPESYALSHMAACHSVCYPHTYSPPPLHCAGCPALHGVIKYPQAPRHGLLHSCMPPIPILMGMGKKCKLKEGGGETPAVATEAGAGGKWCTDQKPSLLRGLIWPIGHPLDSLGINYQKCLACVILCTNKLHGTLTKLPLETFYLIGLVSRRCFTNLHTMDLKSENFDNRSILITGANK